MVLSASNLETAPVIEPFFASKGWQPLDFQQETWQAFLAGKSGLLHAPTGLGKTLAVYLGPLAATLERGAGCRILWLTPLRALAADTLRALREPLDMIGSGLTAEARTGDTPAALRARLRRNFPHTFVTTPESLSLMLTHADTRDKFSSLACVIVDEWHELLGTKRGIQTELCLARLRAWLPNLRIWGLSATLGNLTEARRSLLGSAFPHSVEISATWPKEIVIETVIPKEIEHFPWAGHLGTLLAPQVVQHLEKAATTLLFTNTRSQTEIWFQELLSLKPEWEGKIAMHHGSLDRAERDLAESGLRDGSLKCVVATSSLDLGVDFSPVDQVIQIGSPKGIARLLQRAGRSGHQPGKSSRILCVPSNVLELVEFAAAREAAQIRAIEAREPLSKPLDVLVQHLVTCAIGEPFLPEEMAQEIRSVHAYVNLTDEEWQWALGFISSGGKALAAYPRYQKAHLVDGRYTVDDKRLILQHRLSIGTISSDPSVSIRFAKGTTLGSVEESFIAGIKPGGNLIFAGRHLSLVRFHQRVATVKLTAKNGKGRIAIWGGARMPLSSELTHAISKILAEFSYSQKPSTSRRSTSPEMLAVAPILDLQRQWSRLPSDDALLIEFTRSKEGEHLFLFPLAGRLVHEGLGALVAYRIGRENQQTIQASQNDYGFSLTARRGLVLDEAILRRYLSPENLLDDLIACMNTAELARRNFREIARVSGLILQRPPGRRDQSQREIQSSASLLFEVLQRYDPDNELLRQSEREILEKQLEFTRLHCVIQELTRRPFHLVETEHLTPMAFPLWADRLQSTLVAVDAATRLADMLDELHKAAGLGKPAHLPSVALAAESPDPKKRQFTRKPSRRRHGF